LHSLRALPGNDIAGEFRPAFYDPVDPEEVYMERSYCLVNRRRSTAGFPPIKKQPLPKPYEFDIFVYLSGSFPALGEAELAQLLNGFNFKWFNLSGGLSRQSVGTDAPLQLPNSKSCGQAAFHSGSDARLFEAFENEDAIRHLVRSDTAIDTDKNEFYMNFGRDVVELTKSGLESENLTIIDLSKYGT
jgi:hypothetical protein